MYELSRNCLRFFRCIPSLSGRLNTLATAALVGAATLGGCAVTFPVPTPPAPAATLINNGADGLLVPLHLERADEGHARLGLPVQLDGKAVYMAFDTGIQGVRVLASVLPRTNYTATQPVTSLTFANGAVVSGPSVKLPFSMAGTQPVEVEAQAVNDVRCQRNQKKCLAMDGYTGEFGFAFSGIVGAGAAQPDDDCCTQPLRALPGNIGQRYLVRANLAKPFVILSPSAALTRDFTMVPMTAAQNGASQWPLGCVQVGDKLRFCAPVVFSTGSTEMIRVETDKAPAWTGDGEENDVLAQGNYDVALGVGSWAHRYESAQVTIAKAKPGANRIVVGLMAMQNLDVLFDFPRGQLGVRASKTSESFAP
ncbi:hypothetical protein [Paraburkholderia sp. BCC1885]|uniref:hypothetical protein n=1 Tax=Paraburkholderia sp. BCC1885 TaxID=2562669 RepID=UPI0011826302|nr:hypothetical protein [Paraburkholderia sp. BCC1885]